MWLEIVALIAAGLFAGASSYITFVEHPARLQCGTFIAASEFAPSYRRATVMQASLAILGFVAGLAASYQHVSRLIVAAAIILVSVVPFTLIVILPTNKRLLDPALDKSSGEAAALLARWGALHAVRTALSMIAFVLFAIGLAA